jgi:hypothetical protein
LGSFAKDIDQILNNAILIPPPQYLKNSIFVDNLDFSNKNQIVTKWGAFEKNSNYISPLKENSQSFLISQFILSRETPLSKTEIDQLNKRGIKVLGVLPFNSYIVKLSPKAEIANTDLISFSPILKIEPPLYLTDFPVNPILNVYLDKETDAKKFFERIQEKFPQTDFVSYFNSFDSLLRIFYGGKNLKDFLLFLANSEETIYIEPFFLSEPSNDNSIYVVQSYDTNNKLNYSICATIWNQGITGTDETPAVCDTGVDSDMCFYRYSSDASSITDAQYPSLPNNGTIDTSKKVIVYNVLPGASAYDGSYTCSSGYHHGTHVCSSVLGDNFNTLSTPSFGGHDSGDGMAPNAKLIFQDAGLENTGCLNGLANDWQLIFKQAYDAGARIHSNSWGSSVGGAYDGDSRSVDIYSFLNEDILFFFAAGNSGSYGNYTINSPASAKNVIAVGATSNGSDGANSIASFSSKGPCKDGRLKPDIVAPGQYIVGASADEVHDSNNCSTRLGSGTSMATPTAAGAATLLREYLKKGYYPTGISNNDNIITPTSALMKAMLINGAVDISLTSQSSVLNSLNPDFSQGWGRILLDTVLFFSNPTRESRGLRIWDKRNSFGLKTGEEDSYIISITSSSEPLKVTLCWTEPPPSPLSGIALSHDLDLEVISPSQIVYRGNCFDNGSSYPNGAKDSINNVEEVFILNPEIGNWQIKVKGFYIPYIPDFENSDKQGYALVATFKDCGGFSSSASNLISSDNGVSGIDLNWDAVSGASGYEIFRGEGDCSINNDKFTLIKIVENNSFTDTLVVGGKTYAYKVRPFNNCGVGSFSNCSYSTFSGNCNLKPTFGGLSSATPSGCSINLSWQNATSNCPQGNSVSYNIYRSNYPLFEPSSLTLYKKGLTTNSFLDSEVIPNKAYYYIVRSEDSTTSNNGPNNGGNEDLNLVRKSAYTHSQSFSYGTFFDDGGDTNSFLVLDDFWKITNEQNHTPNGNFCYHSNESLLPYPNGICATIQTEEIALEPSSSPQLSFFARYNIEYQYDGLVVEISTDGGNSFTPVAPLGNYPSSFALTGDPPQNGCLYPATQGAFSGPNGNSNLTSWTLYTFDLSSYAGQSVIIRWRLSSDSGLGYEGFYLDDITITNASYYDNCLNSDGSILLDKIKYSCSDTITIMLYDSDLIGNSTQTVSLLSDTELAGETVILNETPPNSGYFIGSINTTSSPPSVDSLLSLSEGDVITANYIDADDGKGNYNTLKSVKAKAVCALPDEVAKGFLPWDIQSFYLDKSTQIWPEVEGAEKYRLYRGTLADLPNLKNSNIDSCLLYEGTIPRYVCSEDPSLVPGKLYWYLVTAVNTAGEGSAGNGRIVNSSGGCF